MEISLQFFLPTGAKISPSLQEAAVTRIHAKSTDPCALDATLQSIRPFRKSDEYSSKRLYDFTFAIPPHGSASPSNFFLTNVS